MKIEYDKNADAVYIYMISDKYVKPGWVKKTYPCDVSEIGGMVNFDFDSDGHIGGIEIVDASKILPLEVLESATRIDT